jgi:hypothetical protein
LPLKGEIVMKKIWSSLVLLCMLATPALAGDLVNVSGASGFALDGYDPVAFFTEGTPAHGNPGITAAHKGATYMFASKSHKEMFTQNPEKYLPQYGGYCAYGVAVGALFPVDINTWQIRNGKLYLNLNPDVLALFNQDVEGYIAKAEKQWPDLVRKHQM